jgi:hypothetical protein
MTTKNPRVSVTLAWAVAIGALALNLPALAHHSFAMFDFSKTATVQGVVKEFRWTNPHVVLIVTAPASASEPEQDWTMELTSPGNLTRMGWSRHSFNPGERIELTFNPLRDGKHGGAFDQAKVLDTGKVWSSDLREAEKPGLK